MPRNVPRKRESDMLAVIHWKINGKSGHGSAIDAAEAEIWVRVMNYKWGSGTHWLEYCDGN